MLGQLELLAGGVEEATQIDVGHMIAQAALHDVQVKVVLGAINTGVGPEQDLVKLFWVGDVHVLGQAALAYLLGHPLGRRQIQVGDHNLDHVFG
jgi:hypothetical protein